MRSEPGARRAKSRSALARCRGLTPIASTALLCLALGAASAAIIGPDDRVSVSYAEPGLGPFDGTRESFIRLSRVGYLAHVSMREIHATGTVTCFPDIVVTSAHVLSFFAGGTRAEQDGFIRSYRFRLNDAEEPGEHLEQFEIEDFRIGTWDPNADVQDDLLVLRLGSGRRHAGTPRHVVPLALPETGRAAGAVPPVLYNAAFHSDVGLDAGGRTRAGDQGLAKAGRVPVIVKGWIKQKPDDLGVIYPLLDHPAITIYTHDTFELASGSALFSHINSPYSVHRLDTLEVVHKGHSPNLGTAQAGEAGPFHPSLRFNYGISVRTSPFVHNAIAELKSLAPERVSAACIPPIERALNFTERDFKAYR